MAETFLIPSNGDVYRDAPAHTVYTRSTWSEPWTQQSAIYCNRAHWGSGPVRSQAEFQYRFGEGKPPGQSTFSAYDRVDLLGQYIKLKIAQEAGENSIFWYGIITDNAVMRDGAFLTSGGTRQETGKQILTAEGLEIFLLRSFVTSARIDQGTAWPKTILRGLSFNDPAGYEGVGNRAGSAAPGGGYVFSSDPGNPFDAQWWSSRQILEYLIGWHYPVDKDGEQRVDWRLSERAKTTLPDWDKPVVRSHGRSLHSLIEEICNRRRNLSWRVTVEAEGTNPDGWKQVYVDVFSFNADPITLPGGGIQAANTSTVALDFDLAVDASALQRDAEQQKVEQVVVRGGRRRAVGSFSYADGTLTGDWHATDEADYETLPAAISALTNPSEQQTRMAAYRAEDRLARVFSWFRIPADWDGKVGDGQGGLKSDLAPVLEGEPGKVDWYVPELRFERFLPPELMQETAPADGTQQLPPPIALIETENSKFEYVEKLGPAGAGQEDRADGDGRQWSCSLKVRRDQPGIILKVHGTKSAEGEGQHLIAASDFTAISVINDKIDLDWRTVILTAMIELDEYVEVKYPADQDVSATLDVVRTVYVNLPEDTARLDWVHADTVIGLIDGTPVQALGAPGYYLRDDRPKMRDLARFVYDWYSIPRKAFTLRLKQLSGMVEVGDLITTLGADETEETVNALVTGVTMDLLAVTSRVTTGFAVLDPIQLL